MNKEMVRRLLPAAGFALLAAAGWFWLRPGPSPLNVVLVSLDTLRPDHLGCYGYSRDTSPTIDRLAAEGTIFETVISSTSWTLPAHHALLTSLPDPVHGVLWDNHRLDDARITLAEVLSENGYRTAGIFTGPYLLPRFGFDQGFDEYIDATLFDKKLTGADVLIASERGRTTTGALDKVGRWLDKDASRPFFLFLHLFDIHPDFDPPPPYDTLFDPDYEGRIKGTDVFHNERIHSGMSGKDLEHLKALYDGEIRFVDEAGVGRLVKMLEKRGLLDDTLLVITADHGEEFFEHGEFGHRLNLHDTSLRIPLIFRAPGHIPAGRVVGEQVGIIDIMPTILSVIGLPPSPEGMGRDLMPAMRGDSSPPPPAVFSELTGGDLHLESYRREEFKIVLDFKQGKLRYFDLLADPAEKKPVADSSDDRLREVLAEFETMREDMSARRRIIPRGLDRTEPMDAEIRQRLESLGYIGR